MAKVKSLSKTKIIGGVYFLVVILILAFLFFNNKGILKYLEVKNRVESLEREIKSSEKRIEKIEAEMDSLRNDRFKKEKTAREEYNMKRPLEKGLDVKIKTNGNQE